MHNYNRRGWIRQNASLLSLALGAQAFKSIAHTDIANAAQATSDPKMRLGLVTYLWGQHMDLETLISTCEASGYAGVELRTEHAHHVEPSLSTTERENIKRRFRDSNVELIGYGSNCEFHSTDTKKLAENISLAKRYITLMHDLGGSGLKVKPNAFPKDVPREKTIQQIGLALREVGQFASEHGQEIRVEVHGEGTSELPVIKQIMEVSDHPSVRVCWNCNAEDLIGDGIESNFNLVRSYFGKTLHVRELDSKDYPYLKLFGLLKQTKYTDWILLEARTDPSDKTAAMIEQRKIFEALSG